MAAKIIEVTESRQIKVNADNPTATLIFKVWDTFNEQEVHALTMATVGRFFYGLVFQDADNSHLGGGVHHVIVNYAQKAPLEPAAGGNPANTPTGPGPTEGGGQAPGSGSGNAGQGYEISFDISGESGHITQALAEEVYDAGGPSAFTYHNAINVTADSVEGIDIDVPIFAWTETHRIPTNVLAAGYLAIPFALFGTTNNGVFRGFQIGEVRFRNASGSWQGSESSAPIQFKFEARPNEVNIPIGPDIVVPFKEGWSYLWVDYEPKKVGDQLLKVPKRAIVNKIFRDGNFVNLGIGT